jgi:dTDP-glucose 4,6-dehydratase
MYGTGMNEREWIYVTDHSSALLHLMCDFRPGEIVNVGSGIRFSNLSLAQTVIQEMGASNEILSFVTDRKGHDSRYALDACKLQFFGWSAEVPFLQGLEKTISWYSEWFRNTGSLY